MTLTFPGPLSEASYEDLKDQLELFLRRQQRRARLRGREPLQPLDRSAPMKAKQRTHRLQVYLTAEDDRAVEDFQFQARLPTRAAAVRELLRRGLQGNAKGRNQATDDFKTDQ